MTEETVSNADVEPYLVVLLGEETFVVSLPFVVKIINPIEVFPLPDTQDYILGIINFTGEIIPLVDLRQALRLPPGGEAAKRKFLICRYQEQKVAFAVDAVVDTQDLARETFSAASTRAIENDFITGEGLIRGKVVGLVDIAAVITTYQAKA
jgi:purine-binding chemotaxis protein CheW